MIDTRIKKKVAPYISFATFLTALDAVAAAAVPNIIDRHSFPSLSGGAVAQVLSAFRYFDLVGIEGEPTTLLHSLAMEKDNRQELIRGLLEKYYASIVALDLQRATPGQLDHAFSDPEYNVSGATRRKAQAFFLKAAQFAELPIGTLLLKKSRNVSSSRKTRKSKPPVSPANQHPPDTSFSGPGDEQREDAKTVKLNNGGKLILSLTTSYFGLNKADRDFVTTIIDQLDGYENSAKIGSNKED